MRRRRLVRFQFRHVRPDQPANVRWRTSDRHHRHPSTEPTTTLPSTTVAPDPATVLQGGTFVSTAVEGFTLVDGTTITLTFDGTNLGANAGCNQLGSSWTVGR